MRDELDRRQPLLHRLGRRGVPGGTTAPAVDERRVVLGGVGELVEAEEAEHQHHGQRGGVKELEHGGNGPGHRVAVAHQREGHRARALARPAGRRDGQSSERGTPAGDTTRHDRSTPRVVRVFRILGAEGEEPDERGSIWYAHENTEEGKRLVLSCLARDEKG